MKNLNHRNSRRLARTAAPIGLMAACALLGSATLSAYPAALQAAGQADVSVWLEWTASGDDGNQGRASFYELRRSTSSVGSDTLSWWSSAVQVAGLPVPSAPGTTDAAQVTGLAPATQYVFVLRVYDDVGNASAFSNVVVLTTPAGPIPPPGCVAPSTAPVGFQVQETSGNAELTWSATSDTLATDLHVWRATGSSNNYQQIASLSASTTSLTDSLVSAGTTYRYGIAWASDCGEGPLTSPVSVTIPGTAPPPPSDQAVARVHAYPNPSSGPVRIQWEVPGGAPLQVRIRLFDLTGHFLAELVNGSYAPGVHELEWRRVSRTGAQVAPGYYEAIGTVGSAKIRERIVLLP